ncbi:hypothetical protein MED222_06225 [Vibrio sp. MED222]|nr:hypothetical protein MED222_06225 [Vibrio sp. MED222]
MIARLKHPKLWPSQSHALQYHLNGRHVLIT